MRSTDLAKRAARRLRVGVPLGLANAPAAVVAIYGGTDKAGHGYLRHYRRHLAHRRLQRNVVFEIGVGGYDNRAAGGSLALWRDYLARSLIVGIDINDKDINWGPRVRFVRADQNDPIELQHAVDVYGRPDIVIDDGSHVGEHIRTTFDALWPQVRPGGLYVIEDLSTSYAPAFGGAHPAPDLSGVGLVRGLVEDAQASDIAFEMFPDLSRPPVAQFVDVAAVHAYPGIAFIEKRRI